MKYFEIQEGLQTFENQNRRILESVVTEGC